MPSLLIKPINTGTVCRQAITSLDKASPDVNLPSEDLAQLGNAFLTGTKRLDSENLFRPSFWIFTTNTKYFAKYSTPYVRPTKKNLI